MSGIEWVLLFLAIVGLVVVGIALAVKAARKANPES
jgi:hypothetical protein